MSNFKCPCLRTFVLVASAIIWLFLLNNVSSAQVDTAWFRSYNGPSQSGDIAEGLALDASGNVYVTGSSNGEYATLKYAPNGILLWERRYEWPPIGSENGRSVRIAPDGGIVVAGDSWGGSPYNPGGTGYDFATVKYDENGTQQWAQRYDNSVGGGDWGKFVELDADGNVYVAGTSVGAGTHYDYAVVKYDADGNEQWVRRYAGPSGDWDDEVAGLAIDSYGNVYVTGLSASSGFDFPPFNFDYATLKYDPDGNLLWERRYDGPASGNDEATDLALDAADNVYITGYGPNTGQGNDFLTIKYDPDGNLLWERYYDGAGGTSIDVALDIEVSGSSVCIAGQSWDTSGSAQYDCAIVKYDLDGNLLWDRMYNGPGNTYDGFAAVRIESNGNIAVTGSSINSNGILDLLTMKYTQDGDLSWLRREADGRGRAVAFDPSGAIYIAGQVTNPMGDADYVTIRYEECACACPSQADHDGDGQLTALDMGGLIDVLFAGAFSAKDACCPLPLFDMDCDGFATSLDLAVMIDHLFAGGPGPCDPCGL